MKKIGILGGTFNPVHIEHVELVINAKAELCLDQVFVMPTYISPHKTTLPAPAEDRVQMLKLAFKGIDGVTVSEYEIEKRGKSYTYQTVEYFKALYPDAEIYFICGGDMLTDFKNWKYPERILKCARLAVFGREDFFTDYQKESEYFKENFNSDFVKLNYIGKEFSSTRIRVNASLGLPLNGQTPKCVEEYIRTNRLYSGDEYTAFVKKTLTEKRLVHTASVVNCALQKAKELGLDSQKVYISALLHDCAKYIDYKTVKGFNLDDDVPAPVVHAFLGAFIAERTLKITDQDILNAIRYHTSGRPRMSTLEKLIFTADMVEEGRTYQGVEKLRELYKSNFEKGFIECLKEEVLHLTNKGQNIYRLTLDAYDYYVKDKGE